jgi:hypothetical protein
MVFIVEMVHGRPHTEGFRTFDCHGGVWPDVLELGKRFGWNPRGTQGSDGHPGFEPTYEPRDWGHSKVISAEDAADLADALATAWHFVPGKDAKTRPGLIADDMTEAGFQAANRGISKDFLSDLIEFLRSGTIEFAWDD